ncbi:MAG: EVE domain-containing protein [Opitutaceae bacterium]|nr:EVE domain-containing protein [Opitutaceae bacterium]
MAKQHWLVKTEPEAYAWSDFLRDGRTDWTGVRNFQARNHLRAMRVGMRCCFTPVSLTKAVLGVAKVSRLAFPDPTATEGDWSAVELAVVRPLARPVDLATIKAEPGLAEIALLRQSRLSVLPLTPTEFARIVELGARAA